MRIEITCPRCDGYGVRTEWNPDAGVCYRCRGDRFVKVDPERRLRALFATRSKYRSYLNHLNSLECTPEQARYTRDELLPMVARDGQGIRYELGVIVQEYPEVAVRFNLVERGGLNRPVGGAEPTASASRARASRTP